MHGQILCIYKIKDRSPFWPFLRSIKIDVCIILLLTVVWRWTQARQRRNILKMGFHSRWCQWQTQCEHKWCRKGVNIVPAVLTLVAGLSLKGLSMLWYMVNVWNWGETPRRKHGKWPAQRALITQIDAVLCHMSSVMGPHSPPSTAK